MENEVVPSIRGRLEVTYGSIEGLRLAIATHYVLLDGVNVAMPIVANDLDLG